MLWITDSFICINVISIVFYLIMKEIYMLPVQKAQAINKKRLVIQQWPALE